MRILILGGTAWLGRTVAALGVAEGHDVVCLARGVSGAVPSGASLVVGERDRPDAYDVVSGQSWDAVIDVSRQPSHVREALQALSATTRHWVFVSTCNVYADASRLDGDESDPLLEPLPVDEPATPETYGAGKVACELSVLEHRGSQGALIARAGLIGGPDEPFDRCGYWPWRFARPAAPGGAVLVPDVPELITSVIDVRDLARFLLDTATMRISGTFDTVGERLPLKSHLTTARLVAGHRGPLVSASPEWLTEHGVQPWMGERSLPLWLPPDSVGMTARQGVHARAAGLVTRPLADTLTDTLVWELAREQPRPRRAGLTDDDERVLLAELRP
ncbi:MAG TPA: NAD-dependent epimerase/dehydratase family protein [Microlunatus sp.]